jgi:hypothetical protein
LTDEQINALNEHVDEFRAANYEAREEIARDFLGSFKSIHPRGATFDVVAVKTVRVLSAILGCSQIFLAHSPAPLRQNQTANKEINPPNPKSDG